MNSAEKEECKFFKQACCNEKFLKSVEENSPKEFYDWKTTIIFYSALHYIKSYAETKGISLVNHKDTFKKLYSQEKGVPPELTINKSIRHDYMILFKLSCTTRYDGFCTSDVSGKIGLLRLKDAKEYLKSIKNWVLPELEKANVDTELISL